MTQSDLAEAMGLSRTSITNIEQGRQRLLIDQFCRVAEVLDSNRDLLLASSLKSPRSRTSATPELDQMPAVARFVERIELKNQKGDKS
jgi:transcriptional regulator with XRE-family HTH domain